jgi:(p)ppGpp synthase/HD superfamily hydrolase
MPKKYPLTELEKKACEFAQEAHKGVSRRFSGDPYFEQVRKVFKLVKKFDTRETLGAAALLHDTLEDCPQVTYEILVQEFGKEVADIVKELTSKEDLIDVMGKADYLLDKMATMSDDALTVKLCDRLQNLSDHFSASDKFRKKYYLETKYIVDRLKVNRQLNKSQIAVINLIIGLLDMMNRRYIKSFESFKTTL